MDKVIKTKDYKTRQEFVKMESPKGEKYIIGLDAGYSSMKVFSENGYFCFPSFAKKVNIDNRYPFPDEGCIYFKDESSQEVYVVGQRAQSKSDINDTSAELYSRNRYGFKRFQILCFTALGIATMDKTDDRKITVQTGLPSTYLDRDHDLLKDILTEHVEFSLKVGTKDWKRFEFNLRPEFVDITYQPLGSLFNIMTDKRCKFVRNAKYYLDSNVLVIDMGFGTVDLYGIKDHSQDCIQTFDNIAMKTVLNLTSDEIFRVFKKNVEGPTLQSKLEKGTIDYFDSKEKTYVAKPFGECLEKSSNRVCAEAMDEIAAITNNFEDYNCIILTGGTAAAWNDNIKHYFMSYPNLNIILANVNDSLPLIYSNVHGYYNMCYQACEM